MSAVALGIDLGASTTVASVLLDDDGRRAERALVVPTAVFLAVDGDVVVGEDALAAGAVDPDRLAVGLPRRLGDPSPWLLAGTVWSTEALMGEVLRAVADLAVTGAGGPPARVAVTHPAAWGAYKLDRFTQAVRHGDLRVDRYVSEPDAVIRSHTERARAERRGSGEVTGTRHIAVVDVGGGSVDVAVVVRSADRTEVLGNPERAEYPDLSLPLIGPDVRPTLVAAALERGLVAAGVAAATLHEVVLVGGRAPDLAVARTLQAVVSCPVVLHHDVVGAAARGAALAVAPEPRRDQAPVVPVFP